MVLSTRHCALNITRSFRTVSCFPNVLTCKTTGHQPKRQQWIHERHDSGWRRSVPDEEDAVSREDPIREPDPHSNGSQRHGNGEVTSCAVANDTDPLRCCPWKQLGVL